MSGGRTMEAKSKAAPAFSRAGALAVHHLSARSQHMGERLTSAGHSLRDSLAQPSFESDFSRTRVAGPGAIEGAALPPVAESCPLALATPRSCPFGGACHACPPRVQTKLAINEPGDKYEQEANRVAEQVMRMPAPVLSPLETAGAAGDGASLRLQRKCACGGSASSAGSCAACRKKKTTVQRRTGSQVGTHEGSVPPIVNEVLRSPGQPLDAATRVFMEPRFGHDFSRVRVHSDVKAAESARAVNALAYTVGSNIAFDAGRYEPGTMQGRQLLAHELTHVVQQQGNPTRPQPPKRISETADPEGKKAETVAKKVTGGKSVSTTQLTTPSASHSTIFRRVARRLVNCTPGVHGAPADPVAELTNIDSLAQGLAQACAILLTIGSSLTAIGLRNLASAVDQPFQNRFGSPPARPGGFLNRLTGIVRPTFNEALSEEMELMARRYQLIADTLTGFFHFRCIGGPTTFAGCSTDCVAADASVCTGVTVFFLCPGFWTPGAVEPLDSATLLIHETSHYIWGRVEHGAGGPGGNFRHAECYASFVADIFGGTPGTPACPAP